MLLFPHYGFYYLFSYNKNKKEIYKINYYRIEIKIKKKKV